LIRVFGTRQFFKATKSLQTNSEEAHLHGRIKVYQKRRMSMNSPLAVIAISCRLSEVHQQEPRRDEKAK
jgi:hypothetical protein